MTNKPELTYTNRDKKSQCLGMTLKTKKKT